MSDFLMLGILQTLANEQARAYRQALENREQDERWQALQRELAELRRADPTIIEGECTVIAPRPRLEHKP